VKTETSNSVAVNIRVGPEIKNFWWAFIFDVYLVSLHCVGALQ